MLHLVNKGLYMYTIYLSLMSTVEVKDISHLFSRNLKLKGIIIVICTYRNRVGK